MPRHRLFLDANVLVTVLCNEYPRFGACARVLSLADDKRFEVHTSSLCLAIAAFFAGKKSGKKAARDKVALLASKLKITTIGTSAVERTLARPEIIDIEDGFQHYSALDAGCTTVVTNDKRGWKFAEMEVMDPESYLLKYAVPGR